jgi:hypothetical protein
MPDLCHLTSHAVVGSRQAARRICEHNLTHQAQPVVPAAPVVGQIDGKGFSVIDRDKYNLLVTELLKLPGRAEPQATLRVFVKLVGHYEAETAKITMPRKQFAEECGIAERSVSTAMTNLENLGLIRREYSRRRVTYYLQAEMLVEAVPELPELPLFGRSALSERKGDVAS